MVVFFKVHASAGQELPAFMGPKSSLPRTHSTLESKMINYHWLDGLKYFYQNCFPEISTGLLSYSESDRNH
jgi:hypothetical protein